jgi:nuclear transport factor 2 (NTF2) superfamily protein
VSQSRSTSRSVDNDDTRTLSAKTTSIECRRAAAERTLSAKTTPRARDGKEIVMADPKQTPEATLSSDMKPQVAGDAPRPPLPPFTRESAIQKVRLAEDSWNSREAERVALAYSVDSRWRNRAEFVNGRREIIAFLKRKWAKEVDYRLIKEMFAFAGNRIAVRFAYESHDDSGNWFRSYGNENWEFDEHGLMRLRYASINDLAIRESERKYHWPLGRRPDEHPELSELGL